MQLLGVITSVWKGEERLLKGDDIWTGLERIYRHRDIEKRGMSAASNWMNKAKVYKYS